MNKIRLLIIAVIVLMLLNIVLMAALFLNKPHFPPRSDSRQNPKEVIISTLHFNANQTKQYEALITQHFQGIEQQQNNIRKAKNELFNLLKETNYEAKDSLIAIIVNSQKEIENIHFNHFNDIKMLCTPEQINDFNELSKELAKLFAPHPLHPPKH